MVANMRPSSARPTHSWSAVRRALNCLQSAETWRRSSLENPVLLLGGKEQWVPIDTFLTTLTISSYSLDNNSALGLSKPTLYRGVSDPCSRDKDLPPRMDLDLSSSSSLESSRDAGALSLCLLPCTGEGSVAAED